MNCQSGDTLAEEQVTAASKEKVLDALGEAASKLRAELGESLATVQKFDVPLAEATTSSLEALKASALDQVGKEKAPPQSCLRSACDRTRSELCHGLQCSGYRLSVSARWGGPANTTPRHSSCGSMPAKGKSWRSPATTIDNVTGELDKAAQTYQEEIENYPREDTGVRQFGHVLMANRGSMRKPWRSEANHAP